MTGRWQGSTRSQQLPPDWPATAAAVLDRDGHWCRIRGPRCVGLATQADHVVRGNDHRMGNLQAACQPCHAAKSSAEGNAARWQPGQRLVRPAERHPGLR